MRAGGPTCWARAAARPGPRSRRRAAARPRDGRRRKLRPISHPREASPAVRAALGARRRRRALRARLVEDLDAHLVRLPHEAHEVAARPRSAASSSAPPARSGRRRRRGTPASVRRPRSRRVAGSPASRTRSTSHRARRSPVGERPHRAASSPRAPRYRRSSAIASRPVDSTATQRLLGLVRGAVDDLPGGAGLDDHDAHAMGDDVVELAGHVAALLRCGRPQPLLALVASPVPAPPPAERRRSDASARVADASHDGTRTDVDGRTRAAIGRRPGPGSPTVISAARHDREERVAYRLLRPCRPTSKRATRQRAIWTHGSGRRSRSALRPNATATSDGTWRAARRARSSRRPAGGRHRRTAPPPIGRSRAPARGSRAPTTIASITRPRGRMPDVASDRGAPSAPL